MVRLPDSWRAFWRDDPGRRFAHWHERLKRHGGGAASRLMRLALGIVLLLAGIAMLVLPGPGIVALMFSAALLAGESRGLAALLDRAEVRVRHWLR